MKGAGDFVSKADIAAEKIIKEELRNARPTYGWIAEEGGEIEGEDPTRRWIVDPLDGTTNFLHGLPHWAISIALEHKGKIVAGVVYDCCQGRDVLCREGRRRLDERHPHPRVGPPPDDRVDLCHRRAVRRPRRPAADPARTWPRLMPACAGVRRWGSAALDMAYVAAGRYEGFWERRLNAWDLAAGIIIVKEAGGLAEAIDPEAGIIDSGSVVCSNEPIFENFAKVIRG